MSFDDRKVAAKRDVLGEVVDFDGLAMCTDGQGVLRKAQILLQAVNEGETAVALRSRVAQGPVVRRFTQVKTQVVGFLPESNESYLYRFSEGNGELTFMEQPKKETSSTPDDRSRILRGFS
jgi:hypothetical protein